MNAAPSRCRRRRQALVVDLDGFSAVERGGARLGDDARNEIADEAHLVGGKRRQVDGLQTFDRRRDAQRGRGLGHVGAGPHRDDARHMQRRARVDPVDSGMGMRAAHENGMQRIGDGDVVDVAAARRSGSASSSRRRIASPMPPSLRGVAAEADGAFMPDP